MNTRSATVVQHAGQIVAIIVHVQQVACWISEALVGIRHPPSAIGISCPRIHAHGGVPVRESSFALARARTMDSNDRIACLCASECALPSSLLFFFLKIYVAVMFDLHHVHCARSAQKATQ